MILVNREKTSFEEGSGSGTIAFWVKDDRVFEVESKHIRFILDNPGLFGFRKEELVEIFLKHKEKIGFEGKARAEIIKSAAAEGWIRVRKYVAPRYYWSIQYDAYGKRKREIDDFILWAVEMAGMKSEDIRILVGYEDTEQPDPGYPIPREEKEETPYSG